MTEIIARRQFAPGYIYFDLVFLFLFGGLLLFKKKYMTFLGAAVDVYELWLHQFYVDLALPEPG